MPGGGSNLDVVGAAERAGLRFVLTHGETAAAMMAGVAAELTGVPGACLVTRGPGVASAANGVAQALLDRQPIVVISDCVEEAERERVSHQRLDQRALMSTRDEGVAALRPGRRRRPGAGRRAGARAAGPVPSTSTSTRRRPRPATVPVAERGGRRPLATLADVLGRSPAGDRRRRRRHALPAARRGRCAALARLFDPIDIPVLTTYKARGVVPDSEPQRRRRRHRSDAPRRRCSTPPTSSSGSGSTRSS